MPELPEVECIRRELSRSLCGSTLQLLWLRRRDIVVGAATPRALLSNSRVHQIARYGKQLAVISDSGAVLVVRLGMTGQMLLLRAGEKPPEHSHAAWSVSCARRQNVLVFRDPRRFGRLETYASADAQNKAWNRLGPDALTITTALLAEALASRRVPIKSALLDQHLIAGVGNIYADEALFRARVHPCAPTNTLSKAMFARLARAIRTVLKESIACGGSTLRDYRTPSNERGRFVEHHRVYGRSGLPCLKCGTPIAALKVSGRTTCYCPSCQTREPTASKRADDARS
jgi:formamidopyrimidine-DNA glycosylase